MREFQKIRPSRLKEIKDFIYNLDVEVPYYSPRSLIERAKIAKEDLWINNGDEYRYDDIDDDNVPYIKRLCVNYLRHNTASYDELLREYFSPAEVAYGFPILRSKINQAIADTYPYLKDVALEGTKEVKPPKSYKSVPDWAKGD